MHGKRSHRSSAQLAAMLTPPRGRRQNGIVVLSVGFEFFMSRMCTCMIGLEASPAGVEARGQRLREGRAFPAELTS